MKQTIEIEVPDGKKAVWKDGRVIFKDIKPELPKTWLEFCEQNEVKIGECYFDDCCFLIETDVDGNTRDIVNDRNILPSKQAAKQHLSLMQLHQLRDCYRQGWEPDWEDGNSGKYVIESSEGECYVAKYKHISSFLAFQDEITANEFLTNFRDLIEQSGDLI